MRKCHLGWVNFVASCLAPSLKYVPLLQQNNEKYAEHTGTDTLATEEAVYSSPVGPRLSWWVPFLA